MKKDSYEILFMKYQRAVARLKEERELAKQREEQWNEYRIRFEVICDLTSSFCKRVLCRDRTSLDDDGKYSWSGLPIEELIRKAEKEYDLYNDRRKKLLQEIMDVAEDRRIEIEGLKDELAYYRAHTENASDYLVYKESRDEEDNLKSVISKAGKNIKSAVESGVIDASAYRESLVRGDVIIVEEDDDFDLDDDVLPAVVVQSGKEHIDKKQKKKGKKGKSIEAGLVEETIKDSIQSKITHTSMSVVDSKRFRKMAEESRKKAVTSASKELSVKVNERLNDNDRFVLRIIGSSGMSFIKDISEECVRAAKEEQRLISDKAVRASAATLVLLNFAASEEINTPYGNMKLFWLTKEGEYAYKYLYKNDAAVSERSRIIKEHDNTVHGYSILRLAEHIRKTGYFKDVQIYNRQSAIYINQETRQCYVPDIICSTDAGKIYIEYEIGNHNDANFNDKCDKMLIATGQVNFIVANKAGAEKMIERLVKWAAGKHPTELMLGLTIKVTTSAVDYCNLNDENDWLYIYRPFRDDQPVLNKIRTRA